MHREGYSGTPEKQANLEDSVQTLWHEGEEEQDIHLESETKEFERFLFGDADASAKLKKLASLNEVFPEVHYSVLLDISGSMYGSKKKQMDLAFSRFREQLQEQEKEGSRTTVSVVLFNHETQAWKL